jgi:hypothetical protein
MKARQRIQRPKIPVCTSGAVANRNVPVTVDPKIIAGTIVSSVDGDIYETVELSV